MDIESECFPCIPMSSAIQLSAASLIGNNHLSNTTLTSSPSSSISSINSLCNNSLSSSTHTITTANSQLNNDAQFTSNRRGRKSKQQSAANIIVTNCNNISKQTKSQQHNQNETKNSTLTALLNCSPLISATNNKTKSQMSCNLPPTPPASNSDSDCEREINNTQLIANNNKSRNLLEINQQLNKLTNSDQQSKHVKRQRANNCSILVQNGSNVINLGHQQLSPNSIKNLTVNTNSNSIELTNHSLSNYLINGNLKLENSNTSTNSINSSSTASNRNNRSTIQSMSSLISVQPKNACSGTIVVLTEEEKRTLIAEGN